MTDQQPDQQQSTRPLNPVTATVKGIVDVFRKKERIGTLPPEDRLDGKLCLVTGGNSGLGRATAIELGRRGAHVILACRSGIPEAGEEIGRLTGANVEMVRLDLADADSIHACCDQLRDRGVILDRVVLNAGIVPRRPQQTREGFEMMFGVHFIGNVRFLKRLLADGVIPNRSFAGNERKTDISRIVLVSSESHRSGTPIDFDTLGQPVAYSTMSSLAQYGHSKLVITAWLMDLARRMSGDSGVDVSVSCVCPGPINSNIARDAPGFAKPLLSVVMGLFFASPEKASEPVVYLTAASAIEGQTGLYLHLMTAKQPAPQAVDPEVGAALRAKAEELLRNGPRTGTTDQIETASKPTAP